jgi:hypothetical protein
MSGDRSLPILAMGIPPPAGLEPARRRFAAHLSQKSRTHISGALPRGRNTSNQE